MADAYMLDTNVFDALLDGKLDPGALAGRRCLITRVQLCELGAARKREPARCEGLTRTVEEVAPGMRAAASFAFDVEGAGFDEAYWNDGSGTHEAMLARLKQLDRKPAKAHLNQSRDILIGESAVKLGATLVTDDRNLAQVVREFGGRVVTTEQFGLRPAAGAP